MSERAKAIRALYRAKHIHLDGVKQAVVDGITSEEVEQMFLEFCKEDKL